MKQKRKKLQPGEASTAHTIFYEETGIEISVAIDKAIKRILLNYTAPRKPKVVDGVEEKKEVSYVKETGEAITDEMIVVAISLFEPHLPHEFTGRSVAYARNPVRAAVSKMLETVSLDRLNTMIQQYFVTRRTEQFRPSVGTIYEFCTSKFTKVEDFLARQGNSRYSLNSIPGEVKGEFNVRHKDKLEKLAEDRRRVNEEFRKLKN